MNTIFLKAVIFVFGFVLSVQAEELLNYNSISASVADGYQCQSEATVRLDAPSEESYRKSRVDMQKMSEIVKTYLWLDCKDIESVEFEAYAEAIEKPVYRASIEKKNDWFLQEKAVGKAKEKNDSKKKEALAKKPDESQPVTKHKPASPKIPKAPLSSSASSGKVSSGKASSGKYSSLDALERAASTSQEAQLDLAKGLLDLPGKEESIEFPDDQAAKGLEILEKLASEGNADAMQILSEAYASDKTFNLNIPLIESLTGKPMTPGDDAEQRGSASARLTLEAAANGSELAVDFLEEAGQAGSGASYYALGMMYLLDKAKKMPYQEEFLSTALNIDVSGTGGKGNVDVGLHFLTLAAEGGNLDAQELLTDMEVDFTASAPSSSGSSSSGIQIPVSATGQATSARVKTSTQGAQAQVQAQSSTSASRSINRSPSSSVSSTSSVSGKAPSAASSATRQRGNSVPSMPAAAQSSGTASSAMSRHVAYSEALIASGALSDILDARSKAASATSSTTTSANKSVQHSAATATGRAGTAVNANSGSRVNTTTARGQGATSNTNSRQARRRSAARNQQPEQSPGNMNTGKNEAEIID